MGAGAERERAGGEARARARSNTVGIGASYLGPAADESRVWHGLLAISDGTELVETLVIASHVPVGARVEPMALCAIVEGLVLKRGGLDALRAADAVIRLEGRFDGMFAVFPPS
jgi:hypothetical protein